MASPSLHTALVRAPSAEPTRALLFLHGILGSGGNLRGLAQAFVQSDPSWVAVLVDLRLHGRSRGQSAPHDVGACAADLVTLENALEWPVAGVVGHSFGGKVALAYHRQRPELERVVLLDSGPGVRPDRAGSEETMAVIALLERMPKHFARREEFIELVHRAGHSRAIADWLAMNLSREADGFALATDLPGIRSLLDSYFSLDMWSMLETSSARVDVVVGGRSRVWNGEDLARIEAIAEARPNLQVHVLPEAGHWVHVDDGAGLRAALI
jgi:esterase